MKEFLKSVAEHYFGSLPKGNEHPEEWMQVTDYLFVFPSRRSGLFFAQYLYDIRNQGNGQQRIPVMAPPTTTIADLFGCFTDTRLASHTQLLFELYKVYKEFRPQEDFDSFVFWGEMLLSDFADIDRYLVDARQLFHNVRDLKELEEEMGGPFAGLSDEAIQVISTFWKNVRPNDKGGNAKASFAQTWSMLFDLYTRYKEVLREKGIAYDGMLQREVIEAIKRGEMEEQLEQLPKHIVFVGITAINEAERALLKWLRNCGRAEFCWDYADPHLKAEKVAQSDGKQAYAAFFTKRNLEDFPNALADSELEPYLVPEEERQVVRMAVPSGVGQTTEAAKILRQWGTEDALHTAVVLADENLLVPMCYSIPSEFGNYNVTMGYSMRATQVYTLVEALSELQNNYRASTCTYYYKAVLQLLGHSFVHNLEPDLSVTLTNEILQEEVYQVPVARLQERSKLLSLLFRPAQTLTEIRQLLKEIFDLLIVTAWSEEKEREELEEEEPEATAEPTEAAEEKVAPISELEREALLLYAQILQELSEEITASGIAENSLTRFTLFRLLQRLAGGQRVSFSGEPLAGLQLMGILETRALDFERIIILSMNEGVIPAKPSNNSFIPAALRNAFGLPTQRHKDSVIAYHFYRLLSRVKQVALLFDSRATGMKSGEESRYLLQLKYLSKCQLTDLVPQQNIQTEEPKPIVVEKSPEVMDKLNEFRAELGRRALSATSLKDFISCPLRFYLGNVEKLREQDEIEDEMGDSQFGDILHKAMELLYAPAVGKRILSDNIKNLFSNEAIDRAVSQAFAQMMKHAERTGYFELVLQLVKQYIEKILKHDAKLVPMTYLNSEGNQLVVHDAGDGLRLNMKAVYDRLDIVYDEQGRGILRVVDYKTGNPTNKLQIGSMEELFAEKGKGSKEAFQVLFYCLMLRKASQQTLKQFNLSPATPLNAYQIVQPNLYFTRSFMQGDDKVQTLLYDKMQNYADFDALAQDFEQELNRLLQRLFDPAVPFTQCEGEKACKYCPFKEMCGR